MSRRTRPCSPAGARAEDREDPVHFDLRAEDVEAKAKELEALGARRIDVGQPSNAPFIPMADPEGNEFCVCPGFALDWFTG